MDKFQDNTVLTVAQALRDCLDEADHELAHDMANEILESHTTAEELTENVSKVFERYNMSLEDEGVQQLRENIVNIAHDNLLPINVPAIKPLKPSNTKKETKPKATDAKAATAKAPAAVMAISGLIIGMLTPESKAFLTANAPEPTDGKKKSNFNAMLVSLISQAVQGQSDYTLSLVEAQDRVFKDKTLVNYNKIKGSLNNLVGEVKFITVINTLKDALKNVPMYPSFNSALSKATKKADKDTFTITLSKDTSFTSKSASERNYNAKKDTFEPFLGETVNLMEIYNSVKFGKAHHAVMAGILWGLIDKDCAGEFISQHA